MAKKAYILTEIMRSSKCGYFIEGTDIQMDFPDFYPIPFETEVLEEGRPVALRLLPHCPYLEKEKQIKNGYPAHYQYSDSERMRITFKFRRLELDDTKDKIYMEYIERTPWYEGNEARKTRETTKTIFMAYDEEAIIRKEIADESLVVKAKAAVLDLDDSGVRNLYRLANPTSNRNDGLVRMGQMRKYLLGVADINPGFIFDGIKTTEDKIVVLLSRAIEEKIVSLDFPGMVALYNTSTNEFEKLVAVNDADGREAKFDRAISYLQTEKGSTDLAIIEQRVAEGEFEPEMD